MIMELFTQSKICQNNMAIFVQQDIFQFDISVYNSKLKNKMRYFSEFGIDPGS